MSKKTKLFKNGEGYRDKDIASLAGFEVIGRIKLKDKVTGKEWW